MRKMGRSFVLFCLAAVLLTGVASANSAPPDYLLAVKVSNDGLGYSYSDEEIRGLLTVFLS